MIRDGWHTIKGQRVYVEDGYILRGVKPSYTGIGYETAYPYWWYEKLRIWNRVEKVKVSTFRNGNYKMA